MIEKDIVKKDNKAAKSEALTKKGSTLLKKPGGEEQEKHVEARLEVCLFGSLSKVLNRSSQGGEGARLRWVGGRDQHWNGGRR